MSGPHVPVLLREVVEVLAPRDDAIIVDGTFGRGGYARALLAAARCRVIAIDRDPEAIAAGAALAAGSEGRLTLVRGRFGDMATLVPPLAGGPVDGVTLDLGTSSPQLDDPARGFSFRADGPLDMRMGTDGPTAADVVNGADEAMLAGIIRELGEERYARRVARAIATARTATPIRRTLQLAEIVRRVVPKSKDGIDPATRTFQALRIHVNDELGEIDRGLAASERLLGSGGRLAVVSFHSLEDRRVKRFLAERSGRTGGPSRHLPAAAPPPEPSFRLLGRKPVGPGAAEVAANPRARSGRLRAAERTDAPPWMPDEASTGGRPARNDRRMGA